MLNNKEMVLAWAVFSFLICLSSSAVQVRICVSSDAAMEKCEDMTTAFNLANLRQIECIQAPNVYTCMRYVKIAKADLVKVDDNEIFTAAKRYSLIPIMRESSVQNPGVSVQAKYKAVVIVRANSTITGLNDLTHRRSCHTGVGKTAGWTVPVANLQALGVMVVTDCDNTVANVANFFSKSCAPGAYEQENNINGDNPANVCEMCASNQCPSTDRYAGYLGALQCLVDGRGDVAFVKHSTMDTLIADNPGINKNDFQLLCPNGVKKSVDQWEECNWATRPTGMVMIEPSQPTKKVQDTINLLIAGARLFNDANSTFNMFNSTAYEGDDLIFTDEMKTFQRVSNYSNLDSFLGVGYMNSMTRYQDCQMTDRWCVTSQEEQDRCVEMAGAMASARITAKMTCVWARSRSDCMDRIKTGAADLMTVSEGDIFRAGSEQNLVPVVAESYATTNTTSFWSVAVVKKSNTEININNLKGKTSCHSGIEDTSGWVVPIGTLIKMGSLGNVPRCDLVKAVGGFFSRSCIPGALNTRYDPGHSNAENLCELCGGKDACKREDSNIYFGDKGAFRCLVDKNADVAFIKHNIAVDNTDGKNNEDWARNLKSADFELLCPDGTRKEIHQWETCNLARIPSNVVITRKEKSTAEKTHYASILKKAQLVYGQNNTGYQLFSSPNSESLIFSDHTSEFYKLTENERDYVAWLGPEYHDALSSMDETACTSGQSQTSAVSYLAVVLLVLVSVYIKV